MCLCVLVSTARGSGARQSGDQRRPSARNRSPRRRLATPPSAVLRRPSTKNLRNAPHGQSQLKETLAGVVPDRVGGEGSGVDDDYDDNDTQTIEFVPHLRTHAQYQRTLTHRYTHTHMSIRHNVRKSD